MSTRTQEREPESGREDSVAKSRNAPHPEDDRKPDNVTEVSKPAWKYIFKRTLHEFSRDKCTTLAAALTYYAVLAMFPALLALLSLLGIFGQAKQTTRILIQVVSSVGDPTVVAVLRQPIGQLASNSSAGFALVVGIVGAIWSASGYVGAFAQSMNRIYEVDEGRPIWKLRPVILLITVILLLIAVVMALLLVVSGPIAQAIGDAIGLGDTALTVWNIAKWPILVAFAIVMIAVLYYGTPNVKQPKFRWMSIGSAIALVVLALASLGFFFYVSNFSNYNKTYGSIGGMIVLLLWLWIANLSLLFGAEFDAEMERGRELQGGIEAEETIQLPPRDTKQSEKKLAKEEKDVDSGREVREQHSDSEPNPAAENAVDGSKRRS
ncbi:YihY/virulence factor BrkB family protein [Glaciibacter sp. 2TAF33]|uniref:YihY/virulence factor BrkB family protein n=1 Tax=Glaciibacter sp. 2TAF33 TaxID=3233015 RepID=UPI003F8F0359